MTPTRSLASWTREASPGASDEGAGRDHHLQPHKPSRRPGLHHQAAPAGRGPGPAGSVLLGRSAALTMAEIAGLLPAERQRVVATIQRHVGTALTASWDGSVTWTSRKSTAWPSRSSASCRDHRDPPALPMARLTGAELRVWLDWLGLDPAEAGEVLGVRHDTVRRWLSGRSRCPSGWAASWRPSTPPPPRLSPSSCRHSKMPPTPPWSSTAATRTCGRSDPSCSPTAPMVAHGGGPGHGRGAGVEIQWA